MSTLWRTAPFFITLAAFGQIHSPVGRSPAPVPAALLDASNGSMYSGTIQAGEPRNAPASSGTVSLEELRNPLEGRGLRLIRRAQELLHNGQREKALGVLGQALEERSAHPYALSLLGAEHLKMGDLPAAVRELENAVALLPADPANHANLAYALGIRGENEFALKEARKALQLDPGRLKTRYILGQILLQMGRKEEAEFHLKKAAEEMPAAQALLARYFAQP